MKELKDILLEKLSIDDINLNEEFPIDGTLEEIIDFLKSKGFKEIETGDNQINEILNKKRNKCFTLFSGRIWFADTSKGDISKKNPLFYIDTYNSHLLVYYIDKYRDKIYITEDDESEFLEELNKRFGWV